MSVLDTAQDLSNKEHAVFCGKNDQNLVRCLCFLVQVVISELSAVGHSVQRRNLKFFQKMVLTKSYLVYYGKRKLNHLWMTVASVCKSSEGKLQMMIILYLRICSSISSCSSVGLVLLQVWLLAVDSWEF